MEIFYGIESLPHFILPVLTIGTFDGVHHGHKTILESVVSEAKAIQGTSILITFDPHPRKLIFPDEDLKLLSSLEERLNLVSNVGIDVTIVVPFTKAFAALSAKDYIENFLIKIFNPTIIVIGYDHHFGHDRSGNIGLLKTYAISHQFFVKEIPAQLIMQAAVSSTQIRKALVEGNVSLAAHMLGEPYQISGKVIKGFQRGRTIGFPTANIAVPDKDKMIPAIGVYAVKIMVDAKAYYGMLNVGVNPTVSHNDSIKVEVNIFDFDSEIYDHFITVYFIQKLRDEKKFVDIDALKVQIAADKKKVQAIFSI